MQLPLNAIGHYNLSVTMATMHSVVKTTDLFLQFIPLDLRPGLIALPFLGVLTPLLLPLLLPPTCCLSEFPTELLPLDARGSILVCVVAGEATDEHSEQFVLEQLVATSVTIDCTHFMLARLTFVREMLYINCCFGLGV